MTDYKQQQYAEEPFYPPTEQDKARSQLLYYLNHPTERRQFEDMVGYQAAYKTYLALLRKL